MTMKEKVGQVFSIANDHAPVAGCTITKEVKGGNNAITYVSLAEETDISAEIHPYGKFITVHSGDLTIYKAFDHDITLEKDESIIIPPDSLAGMKSRNGVVYTEITLGRTDNMNKVIKAGEVFKLKDLIPYQEDQIVNMDVVHNDEMKFAIMAFDEGTGLSEHAAPGEALIFALDGEGIIGYEGEEHLIKAGEQFHFAKGGLHYVKATKKFKMGLLLTLA